MAKGKKKGKKSGKMDKMTEEERILYLEQKMLAEEELRKKKEDMLNQFLKDKLAKEERNGKFNLNKLNNQWRAIMRESKSKELKKDIEILSQTFERVVDRKDSVIKALVNDIEEAEDQYSTALRSHIQNIDRLIDVQRSRLETLQTEYNDELEIIKVEFDSEREMIVEQFKKEVDDLMDIMFAMDSNSQERENEAKGEFQSLRDEIKNKNLEEKHALRIQLEGTVEDYWKQFQTALNNYNETTEQRKKAFEELKTKDEKSANEIEMQMRKLQRIQESISHLRGKLAVNAKECEGRNRKLREEREKIGNHFQELKGQMNKLRDNEREKLTKLTLESNACIKELTRKHDKGDKILRLMEMCRKLETEEEKVLPFYSSSLTNEEVDDVDAAVSEPSTQKLSEIMHEYTSLDNFWKRYNKALLDKLGLEKERHVLLDENHQLRSILKQYLDGISVNDEILSHINPLFVVNQKTNVPLPISVMDPRIQRRSHTIVEAAHVVTHTI